MATDHPPAGWYRDPSDPARQRYWDGSRWAALTQPPSFATPTSTSKAEPSPVGSPDNPIGAGSSALAAALTALTATALTEPTGASEPTPERRARRRWRHRTRAA